jgi:Fe-S-cluster containining protein
MDSLTPPSEPWFANGLRFKCTGCGKCCTGPSGYVFLSESDLQNLADHFSLSPQEFAKKYTRLVDGGYALLDRPGSDHCLFLEDKKCTVYEARPVQCRTFPWWIQNLKEPEEWEEAATHCEGINHPDAPIVPAVEIQVQCLTYLDNLIEQNFSL